MPITISFHTLGCRLNQAETAQMETRCRTAGYTVVPWGQACNIAVLHGCAVTATAVRTGMKLVRRIRRKQPDCFVVLAGCAAMPACESFERDEPDLRVGQKEKFRLPELLPAALQTTQHETPTGEPAPTFHTTRALLKIQNGCNFDCAYCIVPLTRGHPVSRPRTEILREADALLHAGFQELVITGANIACYQDSRGNLIPLLEQLLSLSAHHRIRLSSIEFSTIEHELTAFMAGEPRICRYLHAPLQSGDDEILTRMGRRYSVIEYSQAIEHACRLLPHAGIGTDLIAGFPGESEQQFLNTFELVQALPFSNLHVFPYSPRPGTRAAKLPDDVPAKQKQERVTALQRLGQEKRAQFTQRWVGHPVEVLVEQIRNGYAEGWTGEYLRTRLISGKVKPNTVRCVCPHECQGDLLLAKAV